MKTPWEDQARLDVDTLVNVSDDARTEAEKRLVKMGALLDTLIRKGKVSALESFDLLIRSDGPVKL